MSVKLLAMALIGALLAGAAIPAGVALADTDIGPRRLAAARLVELTRADKILDPTFDAVLQQDLPLPLMEQAKDNPAMAEEMKALILDAMREEAKEIERIQAEVYAERFTLTEIDELIAFYQSKTGQKYLGVGPEVVQRVAARQLAIASRILAQMDALLEKYQAGTPQN